MDNLQSKYAPLEMAKQIGEPLDPRKPYPDIVEAVCVVDTAEPTDYVYYHTYLDWTNTVYTITSTGAVTSSNVAPQAATEFTFIDSATPEYYVTINSLASAKEATLARILKGINQTLNMKENKYIIDLGIAAAAALGGDNAQVLTSAQMRFSYNDLIEMILAVVDYGDNYVLLVGSELDQDILLWNWNDNKYHDLLQAFNALNIKKMRMGVGNLAVDSATGVRQLIASRGLLVATSTEMGKPFLFVRRKLNDIDLLGAAIKQDGEKPQRLVFVSPNPINASGGTTRYLAVGITGYEQIVAACVNARCVVSFTR
uniref:Capsid protein n=1 Tax=viral metagenome TaxID=1070528 RepID=A0A6M3JR27_9ZZZZ